MNVSLCGKPNLAQCYQIDHNVVPIVRRMMQNGVAINREHCYDLSIYLANKMEEVAEKITSYVPRADLDAFTQESLSDGDDGDEDDEFNVDSPDQVAQLLFKHLGIGKNKELTTTKSGNRLSTGKKQLEQLKDEHEIISLILQRREYAKLKNTYSDKLPKIAQYDKKTGQWRIYTKFGLTFTATGRMNCVAGSTILDTSRGPFRIDEYQVLPGDKIQTHRGRWRLIVKKFYKGIDRMYRVCLTNGRNVLCTLDHRILTVDGWKLVRDIQPGDTVHSYERLQSIYHRTEYQSSSSRLRRRRQTNTDDTSHAIQRDLSYSPFHYQAEPSTSALQGRETVTLFAQQNERTQPDVRQEWRGTSQLDRRRFRRQGLLNTHRGRQTLLRAPYCFCGNVGYSRLRVIRLARCSSYRREYTQQRTRQPSIGHQTRTPRFTSQTAKVRDITYVGAMGVWDIEVAEDHSYISQGLIHHNSSKPNLQNIPMKTEIGRRIREAFIPSPGMVFVSADYAAIELRLLAHCANERKMLEIFRQPKGDVHAVTQAGLAIPDTLDDIQKRLIAKRTGFGIVYGQTDLGLWLTLQSEGVACTQKLAGKFIDGFYATYPDILPYVGVQHYRARRYGMVWSIFGRPRLVPETRSVHRRIVSAGLRQAQNQPIQTGAADIFKIGGAEVHELGEQIRAGMMDSRYNYWEPLLAVHDQWLHETQPEIAQPCAEAMEYVMSNCVQLRVPLKVDWSIQKDCWKK